MIAGAGGAVGTVVVVVRLVVGLVVGLNVAFDEDRKGFLGVVAAVGNTILLMLFENVPVLESGKKLLVAEAMPLVVLLGSKVYGLLSFEVTASKYGLFVAEIELKPLPEETGYELPTMPTLFPEGLRYMLLPAEVK